MQASPLRILLATLGLLGAAEAFTPARGAAAALALDQARGFEVTAHGLVATRAQSSRRLHSPGFTCRNS